MKAVIWLIFISCLAAPAQLTPEQKALDFDALAAVFAKHYAPYEWKRDVIGFDLYNLRPWHERIARTRDDLEYLDILVEYVASLNDAHDRFVLPGGDNALRGRGGQTFRAVLPFSTDIYDGRVLVDAIDRSRLPAADYPFEIGDELVSIDGRGTLELTREFMKYSIAAWERPTLRFATARLTNRNQAAMPRAHEIGDSAQIVIRRANGEEEAYQIAWQKEGVPLTVIGPLPPFASDAAADEARDYLAPLRRLWQWRVEAVTAVRGYGAVQPVFTHRPEGFTQRLGRSTSDSFFSGTYEVDGQRIGYIRIPHFEPVSPVAALNQFAAEMTFFDRNTDGLVIDVMRNPGGIVCYKEGLETALMQERFRTTGLEIRATAGWIRSFSFALERAKDNDAPAGLIEIYERLLSGVLTAYQENRGRTGALPVCGTSLDLEPLTNRAGALLSYTKPVLLLTDETSASAADAFAATLQDNGRAIVLGMRTMGAGGSVAIHDATPFSEGYAYVTESLMVRKAPVQTGLFPPTSYVENVGVWPNIEYDYMTRENLMAGGRPFVEAFTAAMVEAIRQGRSE
jgi:hypothetical protein